MKHLIFLILTYLVLVDCKVVEVEENEEESNDYIIEDEISNHKLNTHGQNDYVDQESQNTLDFSLEDVESQAEFFESPTVGASRFNHKSGVYEFDFNNPTMQRLRALLRKEISKQSDQHKDPIRFTLNITPQFYSKRWDVLVITKLMDDNVRRLVQTNHMIKYLAEPKVRLGLLKKLKLEVLISPENKELKNKNDLLKRVCQEDIIPELKKTFKDMNFRFESLFDAVNFSKNSKNTARLVLIVFWRKEKILFKDKIRKIFRKIKEKLPQITFESSLNKQDPMNPDKEYLILSFDVQIPESDETTTQSPDITQYTTTPYLISTDGFTEKTGNPTFTDNPVPVQTETTISTERFTEQTDIPTSTEGFTEQTDSLTSIYTPIPEQTETTISTEGFTEQTDSPTSTEGSTEQTDSSTSTYTPIPVQTETTISTEGFTEQSDSPTSTDTPIPVQTETTISTEGFTDKSDSPTSTDTPIPEQTETTIFTEGVTKQTDSPTSTDTRIPVQRETTISTEIITPTSSNSYSTSSEGLTDPKIIESTDSSKDATTRVTWLTPGSESSSVVFTEPTSNSSESTSSAFIYSTADDVITGQIDIKTSTEDISSYFSSESTDVMMEATTDLQESTVSEGNKLYPWSFIGEFGNLGNMLIEKLKKLINKG